MRYIVGLGNPGERYRTTRHNIGFMVVDALASRAGVKRGGEIAEAWLCPARLEDEEVMLVKPLTFMNRSGVAMERLLALRGDGPRDLAVIVDEIALELGRIRVRNEGSHGGHNGLRSLIEALGTEDFPRIRVGIRKGEVDDLAQYVLEPFPHEDVLIVREAVARAADATLCLLREGTEAAMNRFNGPPPG